MSVMSELYMEQATIRGYLRDTVTILRIRAKWPMADAFSKAGLFTLQEIFAVFRKTFHWLDYSDAELMVSVGALYERSANMGYFDTNKEIPLG